VNISVKMANTLNLSHNKDYDDYEYSGYEDNHSYNANVKGGGGGGEKNGKSARSGKKGNKDIYNNKHIRTQDFMKENSKAKRL